LRAFFALDLDDASRAEVATLLGAIATMKERPRDLRLVDEHRLHLTLQFLGDVEPSMVSALVSLGRTVAVGGPVVAPVSALGAFPSVKRGRVLVLELADADGRVGEMARALGEGSAALGVPREKRPLRPHVTLGRLREPASLVDLVARAPKPPVAIGLTALTLYESRVPARYEVLARFPLQA
jgi:2'-5' RNA ligase